MYRYSKSKISKKYPYSKNKFSKKISVQCGERGEKRKEGRKKWEAREARKKKEGNGGKRKRGRKRREGETLTYRREIMFGWCRTFTPNKGKEGREEGR